MQERSNISEFPNGGKCTEEKNTKVRRNKQIQKNRTVRVTGRDPSRKVKRLSKVIGDLSLSP